MVSLPDNFTDPDLQAILEELEAAQKIKDASGRARALVTVASTLTQRGEIDRAEEVAGQALEATRSVRDSLLQAQVLLVLASLNVRRGVLEQAEEAIKRALSIAESERDAPLVVQALTRLASLYALEREREQAQPLAERALAEARKIADAFSRACMLTELASTFMQMGEHEFARVIAKEALAAARKIEDGPRRAKAITAAESLLTPVIAGYTSDSVGPDSTSMDDLLGVEEEVQILSAVIAATDVHPPLALGLFGEWGSGKSFFMRMMERQIRAQSASRTEGFCQNVVQLWFNAWHYSDTDLWASLAAAIIEQLSQVIPVNKTVETAVYQREQLLSECTSVQAKRDQMEEQLQLKEKQLEALKKGKEILDASTVGLALAVGTLGEIFAEPVVKEELKKTEQQVNQTLEEVAQALNYPSIEALKADVLAQEGTLKEWKPIWMLFRLARNWNSRNAQSLRWLACGLVVAVGFGLLLWIYRQEVAGVTVSAVAVVLTLATVFAPTIGVAQKVVRVLRGAQKKVNDILKEERAKLDNLIEKAEASTAKAASDFNEVEKRFNTIQDKLNDLRVDRQLIAFIQARHDSPDYTGRLGSIGKARYDFEKLVAFLEQMEGEPSGTVKVGEAGTSSSAQAKHWCIDRIILYIDDLDRCPEAKVMDVLQAIHLLLAFKLFVVVVGVDPRWLLYSVKQRSPSFLGGANKHTAKADIDEYNPALPLDYLEKIFQIPFTLRPMTDAGFDRIIDTLTMRSGEQPSRGNPSENGELGDNDIIESRPKLPSERPEVGPVVLKAEPLKIHEWERKCMKKCYGLIPSPRAAKRFVNIYRLLRASADMNADRTMQSSNERQRQGWAVMLLLAILIGYPNEAVEILSRLIKRQVKEETLWWNFVASLRERATLATNGRTVADGFASKEEGNSHRQQSTQPVDALGADPLMESDGTTIKAKNWGELLDRLEDIHEHTPESENDQCTAFVHWAPRVARYSFHSGLALLGKVL